MIDINEAFDYLMTQHNFPRSMESSAVEEELAIAEFVIVLRVGRAIRASAQLVTNFVLHPEVWISAAIMDIVIVDSVGNCYNQYF